MGTAAAVRADASAKIVLLVDDEESVRQFMLHVLTQNGYRVLSATNGEEALRLAGNELNGIDLLISDLVMPKMGGADLAARLGEIRPGLKVLFVSAYSSQEFVRDGLAGVGHPLLQKPFPVGRFLDEVRALLEPRQPR